MSTLFIKNMVCDRCINVVQNELEKLGLEVKYIKLGEVTLVNELTSDEKYAVENSLISFGFQIIDDKKQNHRKDKTLLLIWYTTKTII